MSNPNQPDEHGRSTGGVRGAINDLLGRNDRSEQDRPAEDRTADDRAAESERLMRERSGAAQDAGTTVPTGAGFDGRPTDDRVPVDGGPVDGQAPAGAPGGARFEGQPGDARAAHQTSDARTADARTPDARTPEARTLDAQATDPHGADPHGADPRATQQPLDGPTGARFDGQPAEQQRTAGSGVVGAAAAEQHTVGDRLPGDAASGSTPGSARHTDVGPDGPGYGAPAGADHGSGHTDAAATTGPVATDHVDPARAGNGRGASDGGGHHAATTPSGSGAGSVAETSQGEDSSGRERLVSADRAESYGSRWDAVKGQFVDEPRKAVADADALVGELLDELQTLFTEQRKGIERSMAADETSTEDMRLALRRYRSFFDRLLSI